MRWITPFKWLNDFDNCHRGSVSIMLQGPEKCSRFVLYLTMCSLNQGSCHPAFTENIIPKGFVSGTNVLNVVFLICG